jgi:hypothetical protein
VRHAKAETAIVKVNPQSSIHFSAETDKAVIDG